MYAPFFGLSKEPFSIAPDPRFLFMSAHHREALAHLLYGLGGGGGFVLLTGEIGAGKTTVCRCLLEQVPAHCAVAYVFNPKLTVAELLQTVCGEFGVASPAADGSVKAHVDALNTFLLTAHAQGQQAVLVIDEAQALSADVLEQLRLLTNLETAERKLLQIVLIGQPELREMLARPELEQLAQRVIARYHLGPLTAQETEQYIRHRLAVAGPRAPLPFDSAALARIHALSGGVPRRINLLADRSLLGAYAQGQHKVDRRTVEQAAREVFDRKRRVARSRAGVAWGYAVLAAGLLAAVALPVLLWHAGPVGRPSGGGDRAAGPVLSALAGSVPASSGVVAAAASAGRATAALAVASATPVAVDAAASESALAGGAAPSNDASALLAASHVRQAVAWRELALRWNVAVGEGDACVAVQQARLACFRSAAGGLPVLRQLARPGLLVLRAPAAAGPQVQADGVVSYAVLVGLDDRRATVQVASRRFVLTLPALASVWRGEFTTFWHTPPGWQEGADATARPATRDWIAQQLASAGYDDGRPLRDRIWAFQVAEGLPPDGLAGPLTLMRLNRVAGVDEPRLIGAR